MDLGDGDDDRLLRIDDAARDGLERRHHLGRGDDGVAAEMGRGGVGAVAGDPDLEDVERRHHGSRTDRHLADLDPRHVVHAEDLLHRELLEQTLLDHHPRAALVLFRRLEDEPDGAGEIARLREVLGGAEQHRGVPVMPAGMHLSGNLRAVLEVVLLFDMERVQIGAEPDRRPLPARAGERAHHPGPGEAAMDIDAELGQAVGDELRRPMLLEGGLGMGVNIAAPPRHLLVELGDAVDDRHAGWSPGRGALSSGRAGSGGAYGYGSRSNGLTIVRPSMRRPACMSSVNRVSQPASSAEARISESWNSNRC